MVDCFGAVDRCREFGLALIRSPAVLLGVVLLLGTTLTPRASCPHRAVRLGLRVVPFECDHHGSWVGDWLAGETA
jgi:hypothetical protein